MRRRRSPPRHTRGTLARLYAAVGLLAALIGAMGAIALRIVDPVPIIPDLLGVTDLALLGFEFLGVTFALVGALLVVRRPENAVGWFMVLIGASNALAGLAAGLTFSAIAAGPDAAPIAGFAGWLSVLFTIIGGLVFGLGFIFPTGSGHTPAWDRFVRIGAVNLVWILIVFVLIRPGPLQVVPSIDNPFGFGPDLRSIFGPGIATIVIASPVLILPILAFSMVSRYRMSDAVGRQQLKWFTLALIVAVGGIAAAAVGAWISHEPPAAGLVVFGFAGALVPVAIGIAILRHHLYDIDRIVSRTIAYAIVTGLLGVVFAATAIGLSALLSSLAQGQSLAVAASTLLVLALFGPLRRRAQAAIDQRFDRAGYDASRTVQALADRLRGDVDINRLEADVLGVVDQTFHPANADLWLRGGSR